MASKPAARATSSGAADRWIDFRKAIQCLNCDILTELRQTRRRSRDYDRFG